MESPAPSLPLIIYVNDRPLVVQDGNDIPPFLNLPENSIRHFQRISSTEVAGLIRDLEKGTFRGALVWGGLDSLEQIMKAHEVWLAAGGLVLDPSGKVLLMFRRGKWDLPKGKLDPGESLEQCALREVTEETGLHHLKIRSRITETMHSYPFQGKRILKHTYWYLMDFTGKEQLVPQVEEDILDIHWIAPEHLPNYLEHAHANIREVCFRAGVIANPG